MATMDEEVRDVLGAIESGVVGYEKIARSWVWRARKLHALYETACNRQLTAYEEQEIEAHEQKIAESVQKHFPNTVTAITFNRDPRGYPVKLRLANGRYNTWGGAEDGWGFGSAE